MTVTVVVDNDLPVVEKALPAHLLYLMAQDLKRQGWELRRDMLVYLNRAMRASFASVDPKNARTVAMKVDRIAVSLLNEVGPDNSREGFIAVCYFVLKLVTEGLMRDVQNQAVLIATGCVEEAKEHGEDWRVNEDRVAVMAGNMLARAQMEGLYLPKTVAVGAFN